MMLPKKSMAIPFQKSNLRRKLMDTSVFHTFWAEYFSDSL